MEDRWFELDKCSRSKCASLDSIAASRAFSLLSRSVSVSICSDSFLRCFIRNSCCILRCSYCSISFSTPGSRRQLSVCIHNRHRGSDAPDAPLLLELETGAGGEGDVVIGGEKSNQANNAANNGFQQGFAVEPQPPPGQRRIQIPRASIHPKQPAPIPTATSLVQAYASAHV